MNEAIKKQVIHIIARIGDKDAELIQLDDNLKSDLHFDSLDMTELHMQLESEMGFFTGFTQPDLNTVEDAVRMVEKYKNV